MVLSVADEIREIWSVVYPELKASVLSEGLAVLGEVDLAGKVASAQEMSQLVAAGCLEVEGRKVSAVGVEAEIVEGAMAQERLLDLAAGEVGARGPEKLGEELGLEADEMEAL